MESTKDDQMALKKCEQRSGILKKKRSKFLGRFLLDAEEISCEKEDEDSAKNSNERRNKKGLLSRGNKGAFSNNIVRWMMKFIFFEVKNYETEIFFVATRRRCHDSPIMPVS